MKNSIKTSGKEIVVNVAVFIVKEGDFFVSYCPALNLSSYGLTKKEATDGFDDAAKVFIEETKKRGTLEKILLDLGWSLKRVPIVQYKPHNTSFAESLYNVTMLQSKVNMKVALPVC